MGLNGNVVATGRRGVVNVQAEDMQTAYDRLEFGWKNVESYLQSLKVGVLVKTKAPDGGELSFGRYGNTGPWRVLFKSDGTDEVKPILEYKLECRMSAVSAILPLIRAAKEKCEELECKLNEAADKIDAIMKCL